MAIIGQFTKTDEGFTGTLKTLAIQAEVTIQENANKQQDNHPDFELRSGDMRIGAAWTRNGKRGRYISVSFDDPSFTPGFYSLTKSGAERGYILTFERPKSSK